MAYTEFYASNVSGLNIAWRSGAGSNGSDKFLLKWYSSTGGVNGKGVQFRFGEVDAAGNISLCANTQEFGTDLEGSVSALWWDGSHYWFLYENSSVFSYNYWVRLSDNGCTASQVAGTNLFTGSYPWYYNRMRAFRAVYYGGTAWVFSHDTVLNKMVLWPLDASRLDGNGQYLTSNTIHEASTTTVSTPQHDSVAIALSGAVLIMLWGNGTNIYMRAADLSSGTPSFGNQLTVASAGWDCSVAFDGSTAVASYRTYVSPSSQAHTKGVEVVGTALTAKNTITHATDAASYDTHVVLDSVSGKFINSWTNTDSVSQYAANITANAGTLSAEAPYLFSNSETNSQIMGVSPPAAGGSLIAGTTANNGRLIWVAPASALPDYTLDAETGTFAATLQPVLLCYQILSKVVGVTLYDGDVPQANVTGITAMWWDAIDPEGAPVYEAHDAETNSYGRLYLKLRQHTSLTWGESGFLLLWKENAGGADSPVGSYCKPLLHAGIHELYGIDLLRCVSTASAD